MTFHAVGRGAVKNLTALGDGLCQLRLRFFGRANHLRIGVLPGLHHGHQHGVDQHLSRQGQFGADIQLLDGFHQLELDLAANAQVFHIFHERRDFVVW